MNLERTVLTVIVLVWLYVTVATAAYLLRDRTMTVRFEIDKKEVCK